MNREQQGWQKSCQPGWFSPSIRRLKDDILRLNENDKYQDANPDMQHQIEQVKPEYLVFAQSVVESKRPQQYGPVFIIAYMDIFLKSVQIGNPFLFDQVPVIELERALKRIQVQQKRKQSQNQETPDLRFYWGKRGHWRLILSYGRGRNVWKQIKGDTFKPEKTPQSVPPRIIGEAMAENNLEFCILREITLTNV